MGTVVNGLRVRDARLVRVWEKVHGGERLDLEDGLACLETDDFLGLGRMADQVKRQKSGDRVYFVINRYVNPTNVCVLSCSFCDFAKKKGEAGAFENSIEDVVAMIDADVREVHIVGGHHPDWPFEYYERLVQAIHATRPDAQIKAFTAAEIDYLWRRWKIEPSEALARLKAAGLHTLPGGGAEIFSARLQKALHFTGKAGADRWLEIHRIAHGLGIPSNATMLYGHIETEEERVDHLLALRGLQDETSGFVAFIPLAFHPANTALSHLPPTSGYLDIKSIAVSRLLLDNFDHIKAYWIMLTPSIAQIALRFGADDIDGTVVEEKIYHDAGATTAQFTPRAELERLIREAGRVPVERDTLYRPVDRSKMPPPPGTRPDVTLSLNI
jgi:aminodeoxyfutalosine synthase